MRRYHYLIFFLVCYIALAPFALCKLAAEHGAAAGVFAEFARERDAYMERAEIWHGGKAETDWAEQDLTGETGGAKEAGSTENAEKTGEGESPQPPAQADVSGNTPPEEKESLSGSGTQEEAFPTREAFFEDVLFIGDSRTVGLAEYSDLGGASVFANKGMSVYRLYSLKNAFPGPVYLNEALQEKQYRRIYFMVGINELGYDFEHTMALYEEEILKIQQAQPEAEIVLEANLHVTTERSQEDGIYNNEKINAFNERILQLAGKYGFGYIDVNGIFDDETGGLDPAYTHDGIHVLAKYYQQWADWIWENASGEII